VIVAQPPRKLYGIPEDLDDVDIIKPDLGSEEFQWSEDEMCPEGPTFPPQLECHPQIPDPEEGNYPLAPVFELCPKTQSYMRGYAYVAPWNIANKAGDTEKLLNVRMPPNVKPLGFNDGVAEIQPIPGMIKLIPGVPFVYHIDGDVEQPITVACLQTTKSLCAYPQVASDIQELTNQLLTLTFGQQQDRGFIQKPIYQFRGLKRNQRSAKVHEDSFNGSFNLAATVGQGDGEGCYMPAAQLLDSNLRHAVADVTSVLHKLFRIIVPRCISKFEWDAIEFHSRMYNVFGFGGFEPNNTGLQMNVSSGFNSLAELIGKHQGSFHTDQHDHPPRYTLLTLCFNLPDGMCSLLLFTLHPLTNAQTGADHGPFILARQGLYAWENGVRIFHLLFKGNDLHSGSSPTCLPLTTELKSEIEGCISLADPPNCIGYVSYPVSVASTRSASMSVS